MSRCCGAENHGSGYNQSLGPTNASATPTISNMLVEDIALTQVLGPSEIFTLAEAPIHNLTFKNVTWTSKRSIEEERGGGGGGGAGYICEGWEGKAIVQGHLFATGHSDGLTPPLPVGCSFLGPA
eukprot:COSAG06_NODE_3663_length_5054_cov_9.394722_4_plen_125_part_00